MTWQSRAEHSASCLPPFCAKVVMMVGKGRAAVAEKPPHICKVAAYIIAWLQKGKPRQGGRKRSTCGSQSDFDPSFGRHIVGIPAPVRAQHSPALSQHSGPEARRGWQHITQRPGLGCRCCGSADRAASRAAVAGARTCPATDVDCNTAGRSELILSHHDIMQPVSQG